MRRRALIVILAASTCVLGPRSSGQIQSADDQFDASVARPAFTQKHPSILFDEAHHNFHTAAGLYKPFVTLITNDGCRVTSNHKPFTKDLLESHHILVIANASGGLKADGGDPANPAFTAVECQAVEEWVKQGGALLLITDLYPYGAAAQNLAKRFRVDMSQALTIDPRNSMARAPANLIFARANGLLGDHPITSGRGSSEQVNSVVTYSGQSLMGPPGSAGFLLLGDTAMDRSPVDNSLISAAGRAQGVAFIHGKGRVVVLGEAAVLTAQVDQEGRPFGMGASGTDNRQLALNIVHWLSGLTAVNPRAASGKKTASRRPVSSSPKAKSKSPNSKQTPPANPEPEPPGRPRVD